MLGGDVEIAVGPAGGQVEIAARGRLPWLLEEVGKVFFRKPAALSSVPVVVAGRVEPDAVEFAHPFQRLVEDELRIDGVHRSRIGVQADVAQVGHEVRVELASGLRCVAYVLV